LEQPCPLPPSPCRSPLPSHPPRPAPGDALLHRHENGGVFGEEGWQGTRDPLPTPRCCPWGGGKGLRGCRRSRASPGGCRAARSWGKSRLKRRQHIPPCTISACCGLSCFKLRKTEGGMLLQAPESERERSS